MAYSYYCTHCGRELDQDHVLMDMYPIITGDANKRLSILKLRLTMQEFMALYNSGTAAGNGFKRCQLTLTQLLGYVANKNNLDDPVIATLTLRELKEYLGDTDLSADATPAPEKQEKSREAAIFSLLDDSDSGEDDPFFTGQSSAPAQAEAVKLAERQTPDAIQAILSAGNKAVDDIVFAKKRLREELEWLYIRFRIRDAVPFSLNPTEEFDDKERKLVTGYQLTIEQSDYIHPVESARICPKCGTPIFDHAGTAKHQSVAFIGYRESGKTSTILSLTHYALNAIHGLLGGKIWADAHGIESISQVELVGRSSSLMKDLKLYHAGIAPQRTLARERDNAYSATLRICNKSGDWHLLTLVDLPGELCKAPEEDVGELKPRIDSEKIQNEFQIALSADAYVVCFDTNAISDSETVMVDIQNVCTWADQFQSLRANNINDDSSTVPMMVLFTKCADLEGEHPTLKANNKDYVQPVERVYMFSDEKQIIQANPVYARVMKEFSTFGRLNRAYHAVLRSSPFGYKSPSETDLVRNPDAKRLPPSPKNIDKLMRWLLVVSGCIPVNAEYRRYDDDATPFKTTEGYCIAPPQNRTMPPKDSNEALARCSLFENSGSRDRDCVTDLGESWVVRKFKRLRIGFQKIFHIGKENHDG